MLHPLDAKQIDPTLFLPPVTHTSSKLTRSSSKNAAHLVPSSRRSISPPTSPVPQDINIDIGKDEQFPPPPPRKRLKTTTDQVSQLEEWFQKEPLPARKLREEMVAQLDYSISLRQLEVWFQNRRAKQKKSDSRGRHYSRDEVPSSPSSPTSPLSLSGMAPNGAALLPPTSPPPPPNPRGRPPGTGKKQKLLHKLSPNSAQQLATQFANSDAPLTPPASSPAPATVPVAGSSNQ